MDSASQLLLTAQQLNKRLTYLHVHISSKSFSCPILITGVAITKPSQMQPMIAPHSYAGALNSGSISVHLIQPCISCMNLFSSHLLCLLAFLVLNVKYQSDAFMHGKMPPINETPNDRIMNVFSSFPSATSTYPTMKLISLLKPADLLWLSASTGHSRKSPG